jgi:transmembrane sensor
MFMSRKKPKLNAQILDEAVSWFIESREADFSPDGHADFNAWLRRSPEHVRAFLQVSAFWEDAEALKTVDVDLDDLIARAKAESNVFPLDRNSAAKAPQQTVESVIARGTRVRLALAASVLVAVGASFLSWHLFEGRDTYATEIGEQRSITLEDGSLVELNALSRLKVRYTADQRSVELLQGQALFKVAKNPARPFVVRSAGATVRAVGTQFDVYRKNTGTVVTVVEGRVAVRAPPSNSQGSSAGMPVSPMPGILGASQGLDVTTSGTKVTAREGEILLAAGEQLTVTAHAITPPKRTNVSATTAWTEKRLVFDSTPLKEVVEEFNRYNHQQLVILDPELYDYHISGVFPSTDSSRMVEFLRQRFGVTLSRDGDELQISRQRPTDATSTST